MHDSDRIPADPCASTGPPRTLVPVAPSKSSTLKRVRALAGRVPARADIILLGDSLVAAWPANHLEEALPGRRVFNFGVPGERVQNTLWRLAAGESAHLRPRHAVILIGTNNLTDGDTPADIARGIVALAGAARDLWHSPRLTIMTIPHRGTAPGFRTDARRAANAALPRLAPDGAFVVDTDLALSKAAGTPPSLDADLLHISPAGYERLTAWLAALILERDAAPTA